MTRTIVAEPLTGAAFAPFGEVIEKAGARHFDINDGMATRYHDLAGIDVCQAQGRPAVSIFAGRPWPLPLQPAMMERHVLGSQAFVPLGFCRWLIVVAPPGEFDPKGLLAFTADGSRGVNYRPGTWHHPLIVCDAVADFLVVDRVAAAVDCDIVDIAPRTVEIVLGQIQPGGI